MEIEINGKIYVPRPQPKKPSTLGYLASVLIMTGCCAITNTKSKERPSFHLLDEYKLIMEKKSQLSRSEREYVVSQFNRTFKEKE